MFSGFRKHSILPVLRFISDHVAILKEIQTTPLFGIKSHPSLDRLSAICENEGLWPKSVTISASSLTHDNTEGRFFKLKLK
jgi:hypothetical protein